MLLNAFQTITDEGVRISAEQASGFAKTIAGDFNPIHDVDTKRFCVPGDLLFALVLHRYGLSQHMQFRFVGMVGANELLCFPDTDAERFAITDSNGRNCMEVERSGERCEQPDRIESLVRHYVAFSGHSFPHVLQPLLAEQQVMFNPKRPLIIYERMGFELQTLEFDQLDIQPGQASMSVDGKRGDVQLKFGFTDTGREIGRGSKEMIISGLRPYDEGTMQQVITDYQRRASGNSAR